MKIERLLIAGGLLLLSGHLSVVAQEPAQSPLDLSTQLIVVTTQGWDAVEGQLQRFERPKPGGHWNKAGGQIKIVVGKNGMGWGTGAISTRLHSIRTPDDPIKQEGDGKSPAGVFRIGTGFGYAGHAPGGWKLSYRRLTPSIECVDDSASHFYNRIVDRVAVSPDWHSSEHMAEAGEAYRWGAVIANNTEAVPKAGSCVFLHIWAGQDRGTSGCTAMEENELLPILSWLDPSRNPLLVQLPAERYSALRKQLHLPTLRGN